MGIFGKKKKANAVDAQAASTAEVVDASQGELVKMMAAGAENGSGKSGGAGDKGDDGIVDPDAIGASLFDGPSSVDSLDPSGAAPHRGKAGNNFDFSAIDAAVAEIAAKRREENAEAEDDVIDTSKLSRSERKKMDKVLKDTFGGAGAAVEGYKHLMELKPRERYIFRSDYFMVDDDYACVLGFFHEDAATDNFPPFWGINRMPTGLRQSKGHDKSVEEEPEVTAILLEQVDRKTEKWVSDNLKNMDKLDKLESREQSEGGTMSTQRRAAKVSDDMRWVVSEIQSGAAYLQVHQRLLVRTASLEMLDTVLERIRRRYIDSLPTVHVAPYHGEQRQELSTLTDWNRNKRGEGFHFTSVEYAGAYSLVTNGLNDATGEYVGYMTGDVNNSAILFDVDAWEKRVVCAHSGKTSRPWRMRLSDMWASKISQAALINGRRVIHLVLNDANLDKLGPKFESITSRVDLNSGEVNMFEVFGDVEDELSLYSIHSLKIMLMTQLIHGEENPEIAELIQNRMSGILNEFYTDLGMWTPNAKENRDDIRLVGLDHTEVPVLHVFATYLEQYYDRTLAAKKTDEAMLNAYRRLADLYMHLLEFHGDLFDNHTSDSIDSIHDSRRVIYDFSTLARRGEGVALAQLVNIVGFAVESLSEGDTVIIHGAQRIQDRRVQKYMKEQFKYLEDRGGRVAYVYDEIEPMLAAYEFNGFVTADWTVLGSMEINTVGAYQEIMGQAIPQDLANRITIRLDGQTYLRRGMTNVTFQTDVALGINPKRGADGKLLPEAMRGLHGNSARGVDRGGGTADTDGEDFTMPAEVVADQHARQDKIMERSGAVATFDRAKRKAAQDRLEEVSGGGRDLLDEYQTASPAGKSLFGGGPDDSNRIPARAPKKKLGEVTTV